ncbi:MAG: hypothetical protein LKJ88_00300 [Bacilli bacterium]|jgi:16S rRNA processing protein RimM|nr:hypothetical protein [Bacilli bacterium]
MAELTKVAHIMSTHGLKGEVKVFIIANSIEDFFFKGQEVFVGLGEGQIKTKIASFYTIPKGLGLLILEGFDSIDKAQVLLKKDIYVAKKELQGKVYLSDFVSYQVIGPEGTKLGEVTGFTNMGGKLYLEVGDKLLPYVVDVLIAYAENEKKELHLTPQGQEILENA